MNLKGNFMNIKGIKDNLARTLELPVELLGNVPRVTIIGSESVLVENYKSIVEYEKDRLRLTNNLCVFGENLQVIEMTRDELIVVGKIKSVEM